VLTQDRQTVRKGSTSVESLLPLTRARSFLLSDNFPYGILSRSKALFSIRHPLAGAKLYFPYGILSRSKALFSMTAILFAGAKPYFSHFDGILSRSRALHLPMYSIISRNALCSSIDCIPDLKQHTVMQSDGDAISQ
jgi:hypothetical protein